MWDPKSLEDREVPPMSAELFTTLVVARLRPVKGVEVQGGKALTVNLRLGEGEQSFPLDRYYERYRTHPDQVDALVQELIGDIVTGQKQVPVGNAEFARVAPKLLPRLLTAQQWMDKRELGARLVIRPVVEDLGVALVLDHGAELEYVQLGAIPAWGVDAQAVYETALANLERGAQAIETRVNGEGVQTLLIDSHPDGYAAERALLPRRLAAWQMQVPGELVLGMPTHGLLLGLSSEHPALEDVRAQVAQDAGAELDGLFGRLLRVRNQALEII
jgi:uncharacterized protein YtpQ (UPF0354 family)